MASKHKDVIKYFDDKIDYNNAFINSLWEDVSFVENRINKLEEEIKTFDEEKNKKQRNTFAGLAITSVVFAGLLCFLTPLLITFLRLFALIGAFGVVGFSISTCLFMKKLDKLQNKRSEYRNKVRELDMQKNELSELKYVIKEKERVIQELTTLKAKLLASSKNLAKKTTKVSQEELHNEETTEDENVIANN